MDHELRAANLGQLVSETDTFTPHRYRHLGRYIPAGATVLDVGCNTGRGGTALHASRPDLTIDGLEPLAERAERIPLGTYRHVIVGLPSDAGSSGHRYDAVILGELIEHIPYETLLSTLRSLHDLLTPDGRLLLTTPNPHYLLLRWRGGTVLGGPHVSVHCHRCLSELLRYIGFESVKVEGTGRVSRLLGRHMPLPLYGSYLMVASVGSQCS